MKIKWAEPGIKDLVPGRAGEMTLADGSVLNFGVIRIEQETLVHFTGQGLRSMFKSDMNEAERTEADRLKALLEEPDGEERLIQMGHIARTPLAHIVSVN
ncbi:MAG: hypothetical protein H6590_00755 [Flavobacteriales bacterium]|nr:hypothetical protein [Flavobacteriales bacterium]